jgi:hypothetical protein
MTQARAGNAKLHSHPLTRTCGLVPAGSIQRKAVYLGILKAPDRQWSSQG